jgi:hypothetical protein
MTTLDSSTARAFEARIAHIRRRAILAGGAAYCHLLARDAGERLAVEVAAEEALAEGAAVAALARAVRCEVAL